jgi:hypothetical protein
MIGFDREAITRNFCGPELPSYLQASSLDRTNDDEKESLFYHPILPLLLLPSLPVIREGRGGIPEIIFFQQSEGRGGMGWSFSGTMEDDELKKYTR